MISRVRTFYQKHERWMPIVAFLLGFLFDVLMLKRVDELKVILQQALYLLVAALLVGVDLIEEQHPVTPPWILKKFWKYREPFLHFLLGTLLNSYAIFYFKSASAFTSFFFIALLVVVLTLNEFKRFGKSQAQVHVALLSLCLISYLIVLVPQILGFLGTIPFLVAVLLCVVSFYGFYSVMKRKLNGDTGILKSHLLFPFAAIQVVFVALYFMHAIPPVPLSVKYMGIYHGIEKSNDEYTLIYTAKKWRFWEHGDQTFLARPGDAVYCYAQIFSPTRISDQLQVRWLYLDEDRGWVSSDAIPLPVTGGREEGYRAVTKKNNYQPGSWRVQIETMDGQEIGRIGFKVVLDDSLEEREMSREIR